MSSQAQCAKGRPLPKFGEWDVNNPSSAEGFTVIFNKARDQKKTNGTAVGGGGVAEEHKVGDGSMKDHKRRRRTMPRRLLCCFYAAT